MNGNLVCNSRSMGAWQKRYDFRRECGENLEGSMCFIQDEKKYDGWLRRAPYSEYNEKQL